MAVTRAGYPPAGHQDIRQALPHKTRRRHPWLIALALLVLAVAALMIIGAVQPPGTTTCGPPQCPVPPPRSAPMAAPDHYVSSTYGFGLDYSTAIISPSQTTDKSISWDATLTDGSEVSWSFTGFEPAGRDAHQVVADFVQSSFPDATFAYAIPGADVGYTPGYGAVYDVSVAPGGGASVHERLIVLAAIKNNVGVGVVAQGPYQHSDPQTDGHPNPADTPLVHLPDFQLALKSVTWKGDPPL
jgi:hypothetical protein